MTYDSASSEQKSLWVTATMVATDGNEYRTAVPFPPLLQPGSSISFTRRFNFDPGKTLQTHSIKLICLDK